MRRHVRRTGTHRRIPIPERHAPERRYENPGEPRRPPHAAGRRHDRHGVLPLHRRGQTLRRNSADPRNTRRGALGRGDRPAQIIRRGGIKKGGFPKPPYLFTTGPGRSG